MIQSNRASLEELFMKFGTAVGTDSCTLLIVQMPDITRVTFVLQRLNDRTRPTRGMSGMTRKGAMPVLDMPHVPANRLKTDHSLFN